MRTRAWGHHASCTCAIGPRDAGGVLDSDFRVHGGARIARRRCLGLSAHSRVFYRQRRLHGRGEGCRRDPRRILTAIEKLHLAEPFFKMRPSLRQRNIRAAPLQKSGQPTIPPTEWSRSGYRRGWTAPQRHIAGPTAGTTVRNARWRKSRFATSSRPSTRPRRCRGSTSTSPTASSSCWSGRRAAARARPCA